MTLKHIVDFNGSLGLILPKEHCKILDLHNKDYVEIYFVNPDKIVIKKHFYPKVKLDFSDGK